MSQIHQMQILSPQNLWFTNSLFWNSLQCQFNIKFQNTKPVIHKQFVLELAAMSIQNKISKYNSPPHWHQNLWFTNTFCSVLEQHWNLDTKIQLVITQYSQIKIQFQRRNLEIKYWKFRLISNCNCAKNYITLYCNVPQCVVGSCVNAECCLLLLAAGTGGSLLLTPLGHLTHCRGMIMVNEGQCHHLFSKQSDLWGESGKEKKGWKETDWVGKIVWKMLFLAGRIGRSDFSHSSE